MNSFSTVWKLAAALLFACGFAVGEEASPPNTTIAADSPLKQLQDFVGDWKGVGQVRRGSNQGAWIEQSSWAWKFGDGGPAITFAAPQSMQLVEGRIAADGAGKFKLVAKSADKATVEYTGTRDAETGNLLFSLADETKIEAVPGPPDRITLRLAAEGSRLVVLLERRIGTGGSLARVAEIGYTRVGSDFGKGGGGPECLVTGGAGTIAVTHAGKTYYVCCTGCKELFEAEPEKTIAEYKARKGLK